MCQTYSAPPQIFRILIPPSDPVFNGKVAFDVMRIDKKATPRVVQLETNFNAVKFFKNHTVEAVWDAFVTCCAAYYIEFPMGMDS